MDVVVGLSVVVACSMVPLALDLLRSFAVLRRGSLGRAVRHATTASLICAVSLISATALALFFAHILPFHCAKPWSACWNALALPAVYVCFATVGCHAASVLISPGFFVREPGDDAREPPPYAHTCSTCKRTVLDADHHCIFTGKCVGRFNRGAFYSFLLHMFLGATFAVVTSWGPFNACLLRRLLEPSALLEPACSRTSAAQIAIVPAMMVWLPITPLCVWHLLLLRADQSTARFIKRANGKGGLFAAMRELVFVQWKPLRENRAWQLALGNFALADTLRR